MNAFCDLVSFYILDLQKTLLFTLITGAATSALALLGLHEVNISMRVCVS